MPITFDTLDELKAFYRTFNLDSRADNGHNKLSIVTLDEPKKRGRKPGSKNSGMAAAVKKGVKTSGTSAKKFVETKQPRDKSNTLTAKIQGAIRMFLDQKNAFTANDVYAVLSKKEPDINKQSVITSVLKQMNSTFQQVSVSERPGNGPRPVKLYNA